MFGCTTVGSDVILRYAIYMILSEVPVSAHARFLKQKALFTAAARANREDRFRRGALVELPARGDLVIMGDLHGHRANLNKVYNALDLGNHPERHLVIQELVHVLEVGVDTSYEMLEEVAAIKIRYPDQVHILMGNHEHAELVGEEVLKGGICLNILFKEPIKRKYKEYYEKARAELDRFLESLLLAVRTENRLFLSHSSPDRHTVEHFDLDWFRNRTSDFYEDGDMVYNLLWSRDYQDEAAEEFARRMDAEVLIVGHTACKNGFSIPSKRHLIIDSKDDRGCFLTLRLDRPYTHNEIGKTIRRIDPPRKKKTRSDS